MYINNTTPNLPTVCFTGHRPKELYGYHDKAAYRQLTQSLQIVLLDLITVNHTKTFISGGAQGFDQIAFWAVHDLKEKGYDLTNVIYIPFQHQASRWVETGMFGREEHRYMLSCADQVVDTNKVFYPNIYNDTTLLMKRNEAMIKNADVVIGCYDYITNDYHTAKGGTSAALRYAQSQSRPTMLIHPRTHGIETIAQEPSGCSISLDKKLRYAPEFEPNEKG